MASVRLPSPPCRAASAVLLAAVLLVSACSGSSPSATATASGTGVKVALGTNNPAQGDCTTKVSETATSVGYVVLTVTSTSFQANIQLQKGFPDTTYQVFMQQVPGSCPQNATNGGTLTTDATGSGQATATISRVPSATTFFVQLVTGSGSPDYTSDRISAAS